jgi:ribose-phosphate pyrophosphokinase
MAAETFDAVWTVAPHLHRVQRLEEVYPIPAHAVSATEAIAAWVRAQVRDPVLVGPDEESAQWVRPVAQALGVPWAVMDKTRHGDRAVEVEAALEAAMFEGRTPVLLDDIASTGQTLIAALHQVRAVTEVAPVCVVIHPVFVPGALEQVRAASQLAFGDVRVVSCDTIPHETNAISVTRALISALLDAQRMGR